MTVKPPTALATMLAAGVLLAGCGGGSSTKSPTSAATAATTPATTPTTIAPAGTAAIAACKQAVQAQTSLTASARERLETICKKASSGSAAEVNKVAREVCEELIKSEPIPAGTAKEEALKACRSR
jgi:Spy/CpxP family protein refolding chaperone